jgi:class 3 adenylate cyclase
VTQVQPSVLEEARSALAAHEWETARERFLEAQAHVPLAPSDLELLSEAELWSGNPDARLDALERAYAGHVEAGRKTDAAAVALRLFEAAASRLALRVAVGWLRRAERLLEGEPPSAVHSLRAMFEAYMNIDQGNLELAAEHADEAIELARRFENRDLEALSLNMKGQALIRQGRVDDGMALIDESTTAAVGGELQPWATAGVYCATMGACRDLSDWQRAAEWTEEADREMRRQRITGYPGVCRVHRAEVKRLRGDWAAAEEEVRKACVDLEHFQLYFDLGWGYYELGENLRERGDLAGAADAYQKAHEYGRDPEPGLALLKLAEGDAEQAAATIRRALTPSGSQSAIRASGDSAREPLGRSHLLPAQVEIALAVGDLDTAEAAATELEGITTDFAATALQAAAANARGAVLLAQDRPAEALEALLRARHLWQVIGAPYEMAKVRVRLAAAYRSLKEDTNGALELEAARSTFERLGATPDLRAVEAELERRAATGHTPTGARVTRTFMFTDIVTSTELLEAMGDAAWEELIAWHDNTLRDLIAKHSGEEVSHTGDGFFVAFESARAGIDAAVAIQRRLVAHRREHGFAPWMRIGLHTAEVSRVRNNYRGVGVHVAARVSARADRDQILVSGDTLEAAGALPYPVADRERAQLKGIKSAVEVARVEWV